MRNLAVRSLLVLSLGVSGASVTTPVMADSAVEKAEAKEQVWAKEKAIFAGRSVGDLSYYISFADPDFAAWPAGRPDAPVDLVAMKLNAVEFANQTQEQVRLEFVDFRLSGSTAVIYYRLYRDRMADGTLVDQQYDITHTWTRYEGDWRILGGLSRASNLTR